MMRLALAGVAIGFVMTGCGARGAEGVERAGWRVDDRDPASDCVQDEQVFCSGSGYPFGVVDPHRRRVLVVWEGSYEPEADEVFGRVLEAFGRLVGEVVKLGDQAAVDRPPRAALRRDGTYLIAWDGRVRTYSPQLELLGSRRGRIARTRDPHMTEGSYGRPVAHVPGGADVLLYRTMDRQIRAIPQRRASGRR